MDPVIYSPARGFFKACIILVIPLCIVCGVLITYGQQKKSSASMFPTEPSIVMRVAFQEKTWADIGTVLDPALTLNVKTTKGFEKKEFILDSGAVISSLPNEWAVKTGVDLAYAKRITFKGFGNTTSFAYQSTVDVRLGEKTVTLPIVFTENTDTKALLGRKGFFDRYSISFNHRDKIIEITQ